MGSKMQSLKIHLTTWEALHAKSPKTSLDDEGKVINSPIAGLLN